MIALLLSLLACDLPLACDDYAAWSVTVELVDVDGAPVTSEAELTYSVDGGEAQACNEGTGGAWACGMEEPGDFVITGDAFGYGEASASLFVDQDACHVIPQHLVLELPYVECTDALEISVLVEVLDDAGAPLTDAEVGFVPHDELWTNPEPCPTGGDGVYACGAEHAGLLDIWVDAEGFVGDYIEVDVPQGECHVETQEVQVQLQAL